jgi:hypothetical protein
MWRPGASQEELDEAYETLQTAVFSNDKPTVSRSVQSLVEYVNSHHSCYDPGQAGDILNLLRRRRLFGEMRKAADAFLNNGCLTFLIRKYYAQALVDLGFLAAAEDVLTKLKNDAYAAAQDKDGKLSEREEAEKQWAEACGLLGRVHKDRYINARAPDVERNRVALNSAVGHYYLCYTADDARMSERHWHGINAVAVARLARRDRIKLTVPFDVLGVAETIRDEVKAAEKVNHKSFDIWAAANAMEASIALDDLEAAYYWAGRYVSPNIKGANYVDAFEVAGTLRQLEDVWRLDVREKPGSLLLPLLRTRLQELEGFSFVVGEDEPISHEFLTQQADSLQKQFDGQFLPFRTYCNGVSRGRAVARIGPSAEEHLGTGFLIEGADLDARLTGRRLLVTCDHVVSDVNARSLNPARALVTFRADDNSVRTFPVRSVLWSSPEGELDVSIVELDGDTSELPAVPWAKHPAALADKRVLIFGHAAGGSLSFSLGDNRLVDLDERFLQYRAPTVGGSSGSPVFNLEWELVAVHHRGGYAMKRLNGEGLHEANQGSSVFALRREVEKNPQRLFAGAAVSAATGAGGAAITAAEDDLLSNLREDDVLLDALPESLEESYSERRKFLEEVNRKKEADDVEFRVADLQRWRPGEKITVAFLGGDDELHRDIEEATRAITAVCNITLDFGRDEATGEYRTWSPRDTDYSADIRVSFDQGGNWSLIGTDSIDPRLGNPSEGVGGRPHQRSLNLGGFDRRRPSNWKGTVRHEFLHALGFHHEHQNMRGPCSADFRWEDDDGYQLTLDSARRAVADAQGRRPGIYTYLANFPNRWPKKKVDHNLLTEEDPRAVAGPFDPASVMLYRFPAFYYKTENSPCAPTSDGIELSEGDIRGLKLLYGFKPEDEQAFAHRTRSLARAVETAFPEAQKESAGETFAHTALKRIARALGE